MRPIVLPVSFRVEHRCAAEGWQPLDQHPIPVGPVADIDDMCVTLGCFLALVAMDLGYPLDALRVSLLSRGGFPVAVLTGTGQLDVSVAVGGDS